MIGRYENKLRANETSHDLSLRYVSDRYSMLHKATDHEPQKSYQPLSVARTSYHDFTKIRYPIILLKDDRKQHTKNPVIIFKSPRMAEFKISTILCAA